MRAGGGVCAGGGCRGAVGKASVRVTLSRHCVPPSIAPLVALTALCRTAPCPPACAPAINIMAQHDSLQVLEGHERLRQYRAMLPSESGGALQARAGGSACTQHTRHTLPHGVPPPRLLAAFCVGCECGWGCAVGLGAFEGVSHCSHPRTLLHPTTPPGLCVPHRHLRDPRAQPSTNCRFFCGDCGCFLWAHDPAWEQWVYPFASAMDTSLPRPPHSVHMMLDSKVGGWVGRWVVGLVGGR